MSMLMFALPQPQLISPHLSPLQGISSLFWMVLALFILGIFGEHITDPDLMWGMAALIIACVAFVPANELNDKFVNYFDEI